MDSVALRHVQSSQARDRTCVSCIGRWILYQCTTREALLVALSNTGFSEILAASFTSTPCKARKILAWRLPWTKAAGRLQSVGSQRVRHNWSEASKQACKTWSRCRIPQEGVCRVFVISFWLTWAPFASFCMSGISVTLNNTSNYSLCLDSNFPPLPDDS